MEILFISIITMILTSPLPLPISPFLPQPEDQTKPEQQEQGQSSGSDFNEPDISTGLSEFRQQEQEELANRTLLQQQQNWSTFEDPILGIQFEHPSWWEETQEEDLIKYYLLIDPDESMYYENFVNVGYFLSPLPEEMNTLDKFMQQMMSELRSSSTQNVSVNRTSTIGVDNIPAYKVESETVIEDILHAKSIRYFAIDNSTGTGYLFSLTTEMDRLQENAPLFERMVESFKILA